MYEIYREMSGLSQKIKRETCEVADTASEKGEGVLICEFSKIIGFVLSFTKKVKFSEKREGRAPCAFPLKPPLLCIACLSAESKCNFSKSCHILGPSFAHA